MNDMAPNKDSESTFDKARKLRVPWRYYGFCVLILPTIIFALISFRMWFKYDENRRALEMAKSSQAEKITKTSAEILNQMIGEIQRQTDSAAAALTQKKLGKIDSSIEAELNSTADALARFSVDCDLGSATLSEATVNGHRAVDVTGGGAKKLGDASQVHCTPASETDATPLRQTDTMNHYVTRVYGSAIAFAPNTVEAQGEAPWSTYYYHAENGLKHISLKSIDYTNAADKNTDWFHKIVDEGKNGWANPYKDEAGDTYMTTYSAIIRDGIDGQIIGVVTMDISINQLERIIEKLIYGYDGFGALTFGNGLYVYHPDRNFVKDGLTLREVGALKNDPDRNLVADLAEKGEGKTISHVSTTTGEQSWLIVEPIKSSNWSLQNTFYKVSLFSEADFDSQRHLEILYVSSLVVLVCWLLAIALNIIGWNVISAWALSLVVSAMLVAGIGNIWDLALNGTKPKNSGDEIIDSRESIEVVKQLYMMGLKKSDQSSDTFVTVPTGVYIRTIDLKDANNANISGRIWQIHRNTCNKECKGNCSGKDALVEVESVNCLNCKSKCTKEYDSSVSAGILFGRAKNMSFKELPREVNEDGDLLISWQFQADIMTEFDYSRYPLEVEYLDLQINSSSAKTNILLVPDVASYKFGSNRKAGLSDDLFAPGWQVFRSYFTLKVPDESKPTLGMKQDFDKAPFNELHFKIGLKRVFVDAFITNLTPLIVVAIILFAVALLPNSIDISRVLGICVSVFFVVVFSHLAIRRNIATGEIFYLEYFFFTIYLALLLVPVDAFRETLGIRSKIFEFKNGLVYKVLYWPSLLGVFYVVTALKFI